MKNTIIVILIAFIPLEAPAATALLTSQARIISCKSIQESRQMCWQENLCCPQADMLQVKADINISSEATVTLFVDGVKAQIIQNGDRFDLAIE